jgi:hypothetical protein
MTVSPDWRKGWTGAASAVDFFSGTILLQHGGEAMARRQRSESDESPDTEVLKLPEKKKDEEEKPDTVKVGITLAGETEYRLRVMATCLGTTPSKMIQRILLKELRGFSLPRGYKYAPKSQRSSPEACIDQGQTSEVA